MDGVGHFTIFFRVCCLLRIRYRRAPETTEACENTFAVDFNLVNALLQGTKLEGVEV